MHDAFAKGTVWHRRLSPRAHAFRYRLYFSLLNVDRLEETFAASRFWSFERFNLVTFRRSDFLGPQEVALGQAVRDRVQGETGLRPDGPIYMLAHLRQWGCCMNPVTFYFCHHDDELAFIVAEVHNTPWGERHAYVLDCQGQHGPDYRFTFDKTFHVSPFLPMAMGYDWRFCLEAQSLTVHMLVTEQGRECFSAGMKLACQPMTARTMLTMPLKFPMITARVLAGIYWQALKLWLKRTPFHTHPDKEPEHS
jgi:DUF1365 family protein